MAKLEAVLLDFDGTLADSIGALERAYFEFLRSHSRTGSSAEFAELNGPSLPEVVELLRIRHSLVPSFDNLYDAYQRHLLARYQEVAPFEGANELLNFAREHDLKVGLVTSSPRMFIQGFLERHNWLELFDAIVTADRVKHSKPDPEIYRIAIGELQVEAERSIAVEDSTNGVKAATGAGLRVIKIGDSGAITLHDVRRKLIEIF